MAACSQISPKKHHDGILGEHLSTFGGEIDFMNKPVLLILNINF